jgi:coenzyme F420-reducing hydrogenase beta subunit
MTVTINAPIQSVIDNDLCIACGACVSVCPEGVIKPAYSSKRGAHEVGIVDPSMCAPCEKPCGGVCPSIKPLAAMLAKEKTRLGRIVNVHVGFSRAFQFNGVSSSGGVIREICHHFLSRGVHVICLTEKRSAEKSSYEAGVLKKLNDLERMPGSIYHSISFLNALDALQNNAGPFLLVAIPCHLEGISNYIALHKPELAKKIVLKLGIICGWMYSDHGINNFADAHNIRAPVLDVKYRGEDKVGKLKLRTLSATLNYDRRNFETVRDMMIFRSSFSTDVNRQRCRLCQNHINIQSDISVGDAWLARKESQKQSIIVTRTTVGETLLQTLLQQDRIIIEKGSIADIEESQSKDLVYGCNAQRLAQLLDAKSMQIMDYGFESTIISVSGKDKLKYILEKIKRRLLRSGDYRSYRLFYTLTKVKPLLEFMLKRRRPCPPSITP